MFSASLVSRAGWLGCRSTARVTEGQRVALQQVEKVQAEERDGTTYWTYDHLSQVDLWSKSHCITPTVTVRQPHGTCTEHHQDRSTLYLQVSQIDTLPCTAVYSKATAGPWVRLMLLFIMLILMLMLNAALRGSTPVQISKLVETASGHCILVMVSRREQLIVQPPLTWLQLCRDPQTYRAVPKRPIGMLWL